MEESGPGGPVVVPRRFVGLRRRAVLAAGALSPFERARSAGDLRIGYLHPRTIDPAHSTLAILRARWQDLGYATGSQLLTRSAEGDPRRLPALAAELESLGAAVVVAVGADAVRSAWRATRRVPIVAIDLETDPVRAGYAASFARPGGRMTGLFLDQPLLAGKWIELLGEAAPSLTRIGLLWDPSTGRDQLDVALAVLKARRLASLVLQLEPAAANLAALFEQAASGGRTGIIVLTSPGFAPVAGAAGELSRRLRVPTIGSLRTYSREGLMMSYGPVQSDYFSRAAVLADRVARGEPAGSLPIEQPVRFELVLNRRTAGALGLRFGDGLLMRADEVIE